MAGEREAVGRGICGTRGVQGCRLVDFYNKVGDFFMSYRLKSIQQIFTNYTYFVIQGDFRENAPRILRYIS